jgi:hypothetical protein
MRFRIPPFFPPYAVLVLVITYAIGSLWLGLSRLDAITERTDATARNGATVHDLQALLAAVNDIETAGRGFALTADESISTRSSADGARFRVCCPTCATGCETTPSSSGWSKSSSPDRRAYDDHPRRHRTKAQRARPAVRKAFGRAQGEFRSDTQDCRDAGSARRTNRQVRQALPMPWMQSAGGCTSWRA